MNTNVNDISPDIRNKLTAPKLALEKLSKGEVVPINYIKLALKEINAGIRLLDTINKKGK